VHRTTAGEIVTRTCHGPPAAPGIVSVVLDTLFSPLRLGPVEIQNRIVSTSHQTSLVHDHLPTDDLIAYHEARAAGGAGLIVIEATACHPTGLLTAHTIGGYLPQIVAAYRRLADAVQQHGTRLFCQLFHGGREMITSGPRPPAVAPSAVPSWRFKTEPRALTLAEIREMVDGYRQAAAFAAQGGLDGVEVCAGFGYLPTQFLSPRANRRSDAYGGSFENRLRFLRELLEAMREGVGDGRAVGCRLTQEVGSPEGVDDDEVIEAARVLTADGLADYVSVTLGASPTYRGSTFIVPPAPTARNLVEQFARRVKAVASAPVIATGRVLDPVDADRLIAGGACDAVGMTRAMVADPGLAGKARRGAAVTTCIGCNQGCIGHYHVGLPIACTVNPWTGFERTLPRPRRASVPDTVAIVGAGPAGCAAAASALASGHRVVVFESGDAPGGQMRLALGAPGHREVAEGLVEILDGWLAGADVRYGAAADAQAVLRLDPDRVIVATGAGPHIPDIGGSGVDVVHAWDVLAGGPVGRSVLVADWGGDWTGLDTAELLAARGTAVRLATAGPGFPEVVHQYQRNLYLERLDLAGVELVPHLRPVSVRPGAVVCRNVFSDREVLVEGVDTLVVSAGRSASNDLFEQLSGAHGDVVRVGDALGPRSFEEAIAEGTRAALREPLPA
jgi:2,4-dienoyl-CoA reductase-like NADH-dependent reductase (Old Yellow Enzyme family)/thioredoxin reductase